MSPSKQKKKQPKGHAGDKSNTAGQSTTAGQPTTAGQSTIAGPSNAAASPNVDDNLGRALAESFQGIQKNIGNLNRQMADFIKDLRQQNASEPSVAPNAPPDMDEVATQLNAAAMVLYEWALMYNQSLKSRFHRYVISNAYVRIAEQFNLGLEGLGAFLREHVDSTLERDIELATFIGSGRPRGSIWIQDGLCGLGLLDECFYPSAVLCCGLVLGHWVILDFRV